MTRSRVSVGSHGRLVIPAVLRKQVGLRDGDTLVAEVDGRTLTLRPIDDVVRRAQDAVARHASGRSLADDLIDERRVEAHRERERHQEGQSGDRTGAARTAR